MNLKSLLLATSAALLAASGARAADAVEVAAEPEAMEYVRVCDTYGTGYFYIPGTETCLRIGGYVRYDIGVGEGPYGGRVAVDHLDGSDNDTYNKQARLSLQTWTGTETELGTLSTYTETRFDFNNGGPDSEFTLNFAWIQLGGFRVGKDESAFSVFPGYAGGVMGDDIVPYGPFDTNLISYTFDAGNGFSAIIALEEGSDDNTIDSYVPHIVAGAKYAGDWGGVSIVGAYDSNYEELAVKGRLDVTVNEQLSLFAMAGWGTEDNTPNNFYKTWAGDWAVWGGGTYTFNDKAAFNAQLSYDDGSNFAAVANLDYQIVSDFHIIPEVSYFDLDDGDPTTDDDGFGGMLRFQRDF